jgi:hypothetical protein
MWLIQNEQAYAVWYANKCYMGEHHDDYLIINEELDCHATWLNFGKYKNTKLCDVVAKDKKYAQWMLNSEWVNEKRPQVIKELEKLLI